VKIKIYDGTQPDAHLCKSCVASVVRTEAGKEVTICRELAGPVCQIRGRVTSCSSYQSIAAHASLVEFQGLAWQLDRDEEGQLCWNTPADRNSTRTRKNPHRRVRSVANPPATVLQ